MTKIQKDILVLILLLFVSILVSSVHSYPFWDWFSYHYYNGYAFVNNRIDIDIMPTSYRAYFNPLLDAFNYLFIKTLNNHPYIITYVSELKYGIFLFVSYKLFDMVFKPEMENRIIYVIFCTIMTGLSPFIVLLKNFDFNDLQVSILVMIGFYILLKNLILNCYKNKMLMYLLSGFLVGSAFGLKYTCIIFVPALFLIILYKYKSLEHPLKILLIYALGIFLGFMCTDGFWIYILWKKFHNPLFPYFNAIFKSPYADFTNWLSSDFQHVKPYNPYEFIFFPFLKIGFESGYTDLKLQSTFICSIILILSSLIFKNSFKRIQEIIEKDMLVSIMIFTIVSFYVNCLIFGALRYISPLFATSAIIITVTVIYLCQFIHKGAIAILFSYIVILSTTMNINDLFMQWSYKPEKFIVINDLKFEDNATVLCAAHTSTYLIPNQNPKAQYVGFIIPKSLDEDFSNILDFYMANWRYTSGYMEEVISKKFQENNNLYLIISAHSLGYAKELVNLYYEAIKYYSKGQIEFDKEFYKKLKGVPVVISGYSEDMVPGPYYVYKLKSYKP